MDIPRSSHREMKCKKRDDLTIQGCREGQADKSDNRLDSVGTRHCQVVFDVISARASSNGVSYIIARLPVVTHYHAVRCLSHALSFPFPFRFFSSLSLTFFFVFSSFFRSPSLSHLVLIISPFFLLLDKLLSFLFSRTQT